MLFDAISNSTIGKWVAKQWSGSLADQAVSSVSSFFTAPELFGDDADSMDSGIASFGSGTSSGFQKFAKAGFDFFTEQRKGINSQTVKGQRVRAPRDQGLPNMRGASQSNIGNVPRVLSAGQSAQRAAQGSPIEATISQVAYRQSRSPLVKLESGTGISIKPRAK
jgi:hypothetical protein